jgi:hypothetical protein
MTTTPARDRGERVEGIAQVAIMLIIGATAGAASFTHVHDVAVAHGQPDWIGWADACVVELMSLALGLELRRRARTQRPTGFVLTSLVCFIAVSLAAQVVEAEPSIIGWLAAALPALGFLVLVKVVLSRTAAHTTPAANPVATESAVTPIRPAEPEPIQAPAPVEAPDELVAGARIVADSYHDTFGTPITADQLADRMRVTPDLAGRLLTALGHPVPAMPPARVNGHHGLVEAHR